MKAVRRNSLCRLTKAKKGKLRPHGVSSSEKRVVGRSVVQKRTDSDQLPDLIYSRTKRDLLGGNSSTNLTLLSEAVLLSFMFSVSAWLPRRLQRF